MAKLDLKVLVLRCRIAAGTSWQTGEDYHSQDEGAENVREVRRILREAADALEQMQKAATQIEQGWRIVDTDNFGGDYPDERFVAVGFATEKEAECWADLMNAKMGVLSPRFYKVVPTDYKLQPGFEP